MASRRRLFERFTFASRTVHHHRIRPVLEFLEGRALLAAFTVNSLGDVGSGSGDAGDLRYCINQANANHQANTIVFDSTVFSTPQTIALSGSELELKDTGGTQTMTGPAAGVTIDASRQSRVFQIDGGVTASLSGLTISGGLATGDNGGGLLNYGRVTLTDCTLSANYAYAQQASSYPYNQYGGDGGGFDNSGTANLTGCTISGNSAVHGTGGGLQNSGTANLTDCTLTGNFTGNGGGLYNLGTANLTACTVSGNSAGPSGGGGIESSGTAKLTNTIVASNNVSDIVGQVSGSNNLIGTGGSGGLVNGVDGNLVGVGDPGLGTQGNYGGLTETIPLLPGSPALGAGIAVSGVNTDQRGLPLDTPSPDIGAFQSQGFTLTPEAGSTPQSTAIGAAFAHPLAVIVTANNPVEPVNGGIITFAAPPVTGDASAFLSATSAFIAGGEVAVSAGPNNVDGSYQVTESDSPAKAAIFNLTNTGPIFASLIVNTTSGNLFPGAGLLSLPEAVLFANLDSTASANISFDPNVFKTAQTITLTGTELELSNTTETETITGPAAGVTISGGGLSRVFQIDSGVTAALSGLTISGGWHPIGTGGGLANYGTATLTDCTVSGNTTFDERVAYDYDSLYTYFYGNGGGLFNGDTANLTLTGCSLTGNSAGLGGGGLDNSGTANLTDCTLTGNSASSGGGVDNSGTANLTACTVSGNSAGASGTGSSGGVNNSGTANLADTIVAGNSDGDIGGHISGSYNLIGTGGSGGLTDGSDGNIVLATLTGLGFAPLGDYGGPTQTMALLPGSPALNAGVAVAGVTTDQRGLPLDSPSPDIGAFQSQGFTVTLAAGSTPQSTARGTAFLNPLAVTITANNPVEPLSGGIVTFTAPPGGPSAKLSATTIILGSDGSASVTATANATAGTYTVVVSAGGAATSYFELTNSGKSGSLIPLTFWGVSDQTITYGTSSVTISGTLKSGPQAPAGETVAVTLGGAPQSAKIGSGGAFSTTFNTTGLAVANSPCTITYTYTSDGTFASASTTSTLTVTPATITITASPETKVYGTADPALAFTATGFELTDTAGSVLTGALARAQTGTLAGEQAGGYAISQGTLVADSNYTISFTGNTLTITPATPSVTVSDPGGTYTGKPIAATATVTGVNGTAARSLEGVTPTLTYYAGSGTSGTNLGSAAPSAAGTYTVLARFPGAGDYASAQSKPTSFAIAPIRAAVALSSSTASPVFGQAVTFVATVTSADGKPCGTVTFADGTTPLATVPLDPSGQAALTTSTLSLGSHAITATYNGGTDSLSVKSGRAAESVGATATAIRLEPHPVLKGENALKEVELTTAIEPVAPGAGVPTGTVTFEFVKKLGKKVKVMTLGSAALGGGAATLTFKPNKVLNKPLTIVYSGDPDFLSNMITSPKLSLMRRLVTLSPGGDHPSARRH